MSISTQQIHTVLRTYNKQLKLSGFDNRRNATLPQSRRDRVTISSEGKKQQIYTHQSTESLPDIRQKSRVQTEEKRGV